VSFRRAYERRPLRVTSAVAAAAGAAATVANPTSAEYFSDPSAVAVTGSSFVNGCTATVGGLSAAVTFVSSSSLTLNVPEDAIFPNAAFTHTRAVVVTNPSAAPSNSATWTLTYPSFVYDWYRADQGITIATGVSLWTSLLGTSRDFAQATGANQPTLNATLANGLPAVVGDGVSKIMTQSAASTLNQAFGYFIAMSNVTWSAGRYIICQTGGGNRGIVYTNGVSPSIETFNVGGGISVGVGLPVGSWGMVQAEFNGASSRITTLENTIIHTGTVSAGNIAVGLNLFAPGTGGAVSNAALAEVIVYTATPTQAVVNRISRYMRRYDSTYAGAQTKNVVCQGDSITKGTNVNMAYPEWLDWTLSSVWGHPQNIAVVGRTYQAMATNRATEIDVLYNAAMARNFLVLEGGPNDINNGGRTDVQIEADIQSIVTGALAAGFNKVLVFTITPFHFTSDTAPVQAAKEAIRVSVNAWLRAGSCTGATLIDLAGSGMDASGDEDVLTYFTGDHLHPNIAGYARLASYAQTVLLAQP